MPATPTTEKLLARQRASFSQFGTLTPLDPLVLECVNSTPCLAALAVSRQNCVKLLKMLALDRGYLLEFSRLFFESE